MPLRGPSALSASSSQDTADVALVLISKKSRDSQPGREKSRCFLLCPSNNGHRAAPPACRKLPATDINEAKEKAARRRLSIDECIRHHAALNVTA